MKARPRRRTACCSATGGWPGMASPNQTRPTGFSAEPPPGPAMPVTDSAMPARERASAPAAISSAVSRDTAPCASSVAAETPSISILASFE